MIHFLKSKLARRTLLYVLLFSSTITLFFTSLQLYLDYRNGITRIEQQVEEIANTTLKVLEENLWMLNLNSIELMLDGILQDKDIVFLEITDEKGDVLVARGRKPDKNYRTRSITLHHFADGKKIPLGTLTIVSTLDNIYNDLLNTVGYILVTQTIKTFVVSAFIIFIVWFLISRHLTTIQQYTNNMRLGRPRKELKLARKENHWTRDDEFSVLVEAFNRMRKEINASYSHIHRLSLHDPLTHLPNRRFLEQRLRQQPQPCDRENSHGALLFIDLDHFKLVNESLGHSIGDQILVECAGRLCSLLEYPENGESLIARIGGDEFIVLLNGLPGGRSEARQAIRKLADKIQCRIADDISISGKRYRLSASIGIAMIENGNCQYEVLMKQADNALHEAKAHGRNRVMIFRPDMQKRIDRRLEIERQLHLGIQQRRFLLYYQPKVDRTAKIRSAEALIRWEKEDGRLVPPGLFIPVAEESELIVEIGNQVLDLAFSMVAENDHLFQRHGLTSIAINVSAHQFLTPGFSDFVVERANAAGIDPDHIILEVTEEAMIEDLETTMQAMRRLKDHGFHLSIDDFGTGYSSLRYLKDFPLDELKIDKFFVDHIVNNRNDRAIAVSIIEMAHNLGLDVVAEGVENQEQFVLLQQQGCQFYQGFLFSRPLSEAAFVERVESGLTYEKSVPSLF
ncbi:MAG TPA: EAL domain-containing protein [Sedimenticola thiotaurini]|uniref:EAL domain-containing protein n=1 Tax=Sedimenticola thiotaurini TaxID=1543721 RepID=A0A831RPA4_9GAMM|nr:EAL domain-containing protein [Sedimenticola thiotaurini]